LKIMCHDLDCVIALARWTRIEAFFLRQAKRPHVAN
jgi:hypothetical protein